MKCRICKEEAVVALQSHNTAFCAQCFLNFFTHQVSRGIAMFDLFQAHERILVALSGGKDSLALCLVLKELDYKIAGLHLDLGIPSSSPKARACVEGFCAKHSIPLHIVDFVAEGVGIKEVKAKLRRPICSACGTLKRYYFNKTALDLGFDALATGHNLDDEVSRLFSNTLRWDESYLSKQGPYLPASPGFVRKVKPLWRVSEFVTANYAFLKDIDIHTAPCPYSQGASFPVLKNLMHNLELAMPGRKLDFYQGFLKRGRPYFAANTQPENTLKPCQKCGYPTAAEDLCSVCRIKELLAS
ncbi:MAG: TIGR00269 family protein [Desulfovibrionaceae bacterium]|nr:TIGR00269 family protein [Desulfovibrionaceae bacterium]